MKSASNNHLMVITIALLAGLMLLVTVRLAALADSDQSIESIQNVSANEP